jgi:hypothetical protein
MRKKVARRREPTPHPNLRPIAGYPGMYTIIDSWVDPIAMKALLAKIDRDARKHRENTYLYRLEHSAGGGTARCRKRS